MGTRLISSLIISSHCNTEKPRFADPILGDGYKKNWPNVKIFVEEQSLLDFLRTFLRQTKLQRTSWRHGTLPRRTKWKRGRVYLRRTVDEDKRKVQGTQQPVTYKTNPSSDLILCLYLQNQLLSKRLLLMVSGLFCESFIFFFCFWEGINKTISIAHLKKRNNIESQDLNIS